MSDQNEVLFFQFPRQLLGITKRELLSAIQGDAELYKRCLERGKREIRARRFEQPRPKGSPAESLRELPE